MPALAVSVQPDEERSVEIAPGAVPQADSKLMITALRFARRMHLGQRRKQTDEQFVEHPIAVAELLAEAGCDERLLTAAYLHDVVEKTQVELEEIELRFGTEVASIVDAVSEDEAIRDYGERKRALRAQVLEADRAPILIYAADRVANLRDWATIPPERRERVAERLGTSLPERIELWDEDLAELRALDPELPFLTEIEEGLAAVRPTPVD